MLDSVLIGDLHLDKMTPIFGDDANRMIMHEASRVVEYAVDNEVKHIIFLGDVCHNSRLSYSGQLAIFDFFELWADKGVYFDFILGNHDHDEDGVHSLEVISKYATKLYPNVRIHKGSGCKATLEGVDCQFLSWPLSSPVKSKRPFLMFGHFETKGSTADNGREIKDGVEVDDDIPTYCGHLHTPHSVGNVFYVGTLYPTSFGESGKKSFTRLRARYQQRELQTRATRIDHTSLFQLRTLVVSKPNDLRTLIDRDGDKYRSDPLWKYRLVVKEEVEIPESFLLEHQNIIKFNGFKTKHELDSVLTDDWVDLGDGNLQIDPKNTLQGMLTEKYKLEPKRVKRAMKLLQGLTP